MSNLVFCPNCEWNLKYNIIGEKYCSHCEYTEVTPFNFVTEEEWKRESS